MNPAWKDDFDDEMRHIYHKVEHFNEDDSEMYTIWSLVGAAFVLAIIFACCIRCCRRRYHNQGLVIAPPAPAPNVNVSALLVTNSNQGNAPYPQQQYVTAAVPVGQMASVVMMPNGSSNCPNPPPYMTTMAIQATSPYMMGGAMQHPGLVYPQNQNYPTAGAPYPTAGAPYPTAGAPYPAAGAPYPTGGAAYPSGNMPQPSAPDFSGVPPSYDQAVNQKSLL